MKPKDDRPIKEILLEAGFVVGERKNSIGYRNIISPTGEDLGFHSPLKALELINKKSEKPKSN